jgi:aminoglycoside phosphotransferase (APT) family kinase protein
MAQDADPRSESIRRDLELYLRRTDPVWRVRDVALLPQGHSGFTYKVTAADHRGGRWLVLRVPPPGTRPVGPADVARQGRIVAALKRLGFPVPAVVAQSGQPEVDGRPFVLFEMVPGLRIEEVQAHVHGARLTAGAVETLMRLHRIPVEEIEIGEEPVSLAGELARWEDLFERARADLDLPHVELRSSLAASLPDAHQPCLVHGDYHCGNLLFDSDGAVVAVLDWEIAELGQPLVDLGCLAVAGMSRGTNRVGPVPGPEVEPEQLALLYGADLREFEWYCAFSCYKYAAVYIYNRMLHQRGKRIDPFNEGLEPLIARLLHRGLGLLAR